ncbi:hypothetical protein [Luteibacter sp. Lutesp34]|uniref:hypothetical protein n=1 Tax=Luteibacter sp. Lutesp34 TaxID=3243030 RepID=UPI0039B41CDE
MKARIFLIAIAYAPSLLAQDSGFYKTIPYRDNDPFVFCTEGLKGWNKCWFPVDPANGTFMYTGVCDEPNPKGRSWSFEDRDSLRLYQMVCPMAVQSGEWDGKGGSPDNSPHPH